MLPDAATLHSIHARMQAVVRAVRLPFRNQAWRGLNGNRAGTGIGSSIDFQDHRPYLPGDDPRYIDWQAYARSGHYTLKLYREEVSPSVDLVLDGSASMFLGEAKAVRTLELFYFTIASALQGGGSLRCYLVNGDSVTLLANEAILAGDLGEAGQARSAATSGGALLRVPWRTASLRVWVTDGLFPGAPALHPLVHAKGRGVLLSPWCKAEADPEWEGNLDMIDCEANTLRKQRVEPGVLLRYREAYARHFLLWQEEARRMGIAYARVPSEGEFVAAMLAEALPNGAVELA